MRRLADGGYVVTWTSWSQDGSNGGIYSQRYSATGVAVGTETRVNTHTNSDQAQPSVTGLTDGGYVVTWTSNNQDGSFWGVYAQRYSVAGEPVGGETLINVTTAALQIDPSVTALSNGGYVVTWTSTSGQDGSGGGVYSRAFYPNTAPVIEAADIVFVPGAETQVNTATDGYQGMPSVTGLADGGYVVTWTSTNQDGDGDDVYAQRYTAGGVAVGGETRINTTTASGQYEPSVTALADGGYVVTWTSADQDGSGGGIYVQRYTAAGVAVGGETRVNTTTWEHQSEPSVAALADGGYVVTWMSASQDSDGYDVLAQRYTAAGVALGGETRINSETFEHQLQPSVAALADGGYVVTWMSDMQDGDGYGVFAQRYTAAGVAVGGEARVNTETHDSQAHPSVAGLADGGYVVTWTSGGQDGSGTGVYAQRYTAANVATGGEILVNTTTWGDQARPSVAALADGGYVVTWTSRGQDHEGSGYGVYAQRYTASGVAVGGETLVNTTTVGNQVQPSVAALANGGFVVTWTSADQDGSAEGVFSRTFHPTLVLSVAENGAAVTTVVASDVDAGQVLTFSLAGGADAALFEIDAATGELSFLAAPDFEAPGDQGGDNVYDVVVQVSDGAGGVTTQAVAVTVTDVVEAIPGVTITGTAGNDTISPTRTVPGQPLPTERGDVLFGGGGADRLDGGLGADTLYGGSGDDAYVVENAGDVASEANAGTGLDDGGVDAVTASVSFALGDFVENLVLIGGAVTGTGNGLNNGIWGSAANSTLFGGAGSDWLNGAAGADQMYGGSGNDGYAVDQLGDVVSEVNAGTGLNEGGVDTVVATISYALGDFVENLTLSGGAVTGTGNGLNNAIVSTSGVNTLFGGAGNDRLNGGFGADRISGGSGNDELIGGEDADSFVFDAAPVAANGSDRMVDFVSGTDRLVFEDAVFSPLVAGDASGRVLSSQFRLSTAAADADDHLVYDQDAGKLYWYANGLAAGPTAPIATFDAGRVLSTDDFFVV